MEAGEAQAEAELSWTDLANCSRLVRWTKYCGCCDLVAVMPSDSLSEVQVRLERHFVAKYHCWRKITSWDSSNCVVGPVAL